MPRFVALFLLLALPVFAQSPDATTAQVDKIFAEYDKPESPGCALAVIKDHQIIYKRGYGMADLDHELPIKPNTPFHVASVSKQFTAFSILLLAQQGKLSIDDKVQKYIPELREFDQPITIRHLLHHTSGLREQWNLLIMAGWRLGEDVVRDDDILDLVGRMKELNFKPGEQYLYCNTGYTLMALIVKRVSGQSLREFAEANIFKPLGMTRTFFRDDHAVISKHQALGYNGGPNGSFKLSVPNYDTVGASSLITTVEDLAKWDQNFYDKKVGGEWVIEQMQIRGKLNNGQEIPYARGISLGTYKGLKVVAHNGADAGYRSDLSRYPEQHFSVVCLCNAGSANPTALSRRVVDVYLASALAPEPVKPAAPSAATVALTEQELKSKTGTYWNAALGEMGSVSLNEGKLRLAGVGQSGTLTPIAANRFRAVESSAEVTFETAPQGQPLRLTVVSSSGVPLVLEAVPPADTTKLQEFEGAYYSEEIDTTYRVSLKDGKLSVARKKFDPIQLTPVFRDAFKTESILGTVQFTRDAQNRINGFRLHAGRVRNLRFVKQ